MIMSACSIYNCDECDMKLAADCPGCRSGNEELSASGDETCKVYECVISHKILSCNECDELSCIQKRNVESLCPLRSRYQKKRWWAGHLSRELSRRKNATLQIAGQSPISSRVIRRLRLYLCALDAFDAEGQELVSSWQLAEKVNVEAALIRKDLSRFGEFGTPSSGYRVDFLKDKISSILRLNKPRGIVWVGVKCLEQHAAVKERLARYGCNIVAIFDDCSDVVGSNIDGIEVKPIQKIAEAIEARNANMAVIALTGKSARIAAKALVEAGVDAVLNLSGELLMLPDHVHTANFDIAGELLELAYYSKAYEA